MSTLRTFCPDCGPNVSIDEDGCCVECGATAVGEWVSRISVRESANEARALDAVSDREPAAWVFRSRVDDEWSEWSGPIGRDPRPDLAPPDFEVLELRPVGTAQLAALRAALHAALATDAGRRAAAVLRAARVLAEAEHRCSVVGVGIDMDAESHSATSVPGAYRALLAAVDAMNAANETPAKEIP